MKSLYKPLIQLNLLLLLTTALPSFLLAQDLTLEAMPASRNSVSLSWNLPAQGETGFELQRKLGATGTYTSIATLSAQESAYLDQHLSSDTTYYYQLTASGTALTSNEVSVTLENGLDEIPPAIKVKRDGSLPEPAMERLVRLDTFLIDQEEEVFEAPPCLEGNYYVAFQLYHDLGNQQTTEDWTSFLEVTLLDSNDTLWTKNLQNDMASQTFTATVFHPEPLACSQGYYLRLDKKTLTGNVPESNLFVRMMLFPVDSLGFNPATTVDSIYTSYNAGMTNVSWDYEGEYQYEFDLEWVFVADYETFTINTAADAFAAKEGVRITTKDYIYEHSLFYPDGKVYFRVRAIGKNPLYPEHRIAGIWSYVADPLTITNPEGSKNWQSQTILAEEGKYKKLLSYMDGSLRNRQALTNLSSDTLVMVAESRYDFEGRKAIDVLPAPLKSQQLTYRNNFNQFTGSDPKVNAHTAADRIKFHYDNHSARNSTLTNTSGAGKYYSPNNDINTSKSYQPYIPDAQGYAYSQVEYTQDNSGRVSKQAGVGEAFRMDSTHTTRYFYGTPSAAELIRLFGTNVGKADHYRKNLTVDPNRQVSVSYEDQEGRAIATALAGEKPEALAALPSYEALPNDAITVDLSDKTQIVENQRVIAHTILNSSPQTAYDFEYALSALGSTLENGSCQSCAYDLKITITDPDGGLVNLDSAAGNMSESGFSYERHGITAADCNTPTTVNDINFSVVLDKIGDYTVYKELTAQELSYEEVTSMVLADTTVQARITQLEQTYTLDSADCEVCTTCEDAESIINETIDEVAAQNCENTYQQIVSYFQQEYAMDTVPQDSIMAHEDYCKYQLCQKNQASQSFESQLSRVADWTAAVALGYNQLQDLDPFFNQEGLSGYGYKSELTSRLNAIEIGTIPYDSNGDSIADDSNTYTGTLWEVTDPANTDFYLDDSGNPDVNGRHILYWDLMGKEGQMPPEAYNQQLNEIRWQLFKSYYMEAKRDVKLNGGIAEIDNCPSYKADLGIIDGIPTTEEGIRLWAEENGLYQDVSNTELEYTLANIENACDTELSTADSTSVMNALRAYFDGNKDNFFRLILLEDLAAEDPYLQEIDSILVSKGCGLDSIAVANPMVCVRDTVIVLENEVMNSSNAASAASNDETDSIISTSSKPLNDSKFYSDEEDEDEQVKQWEMERQKEREALMKFKEERALTKIKKKIKESRVDISLFPSTTAMAGSLSSSPVSTSDSLALVDLYNQTGGNTTWINNDNWLVGPVSTWKGVNVYNGRVSSLDLSSNNLTGEIPESIGRLTYLGELYLMFNQLTGSIPDSIGNASNLHLLWLVDNKFTGNIPESLGELSELRSLGLSFNQLDGTIPESLGKLQLLRELWLGVNTSLTGNIPDTLGQLPLLEWLDISDCINISGDIPESLGQLSNLERLELYGNQLTGNIPNTIGQLSNLQVLDLSRNQLTDSIPASLGQLSSLQDLSLHFNRLSGSIPASLGQLTNLEYLNLSVNELEDSIPLSFGKLENLIELNLYFNNLSGSIPDTLRNLSNLQKLHLQLNDFSGGIPPSLGELSSLQELILHDNPLGGSIPPSLGDLENLTHLYLEDNGLTDSIPSSLGDLMNLEFLRLGSNNLSGKIPSTLGNLINLQTLVLHYNYLEDTIPSSLGNLSNLEALSLHQNLLSGNIPTNLSTIPNVSYYNNHFTISNLLPLVKSSSISESLYSPQKYVLGEDIIYNVVEGGTFTLSVDVDRNTDPLCKYGWYKVVPPTQNPDGTWTPSQSIPLQDELSTDGHTFTFASIQPEDAGTYQYVIQNDLTGGLVISNGNNPSAQYDGRNITGYRIIIEVVEPTYTICLEYAPPSATDNPTLAAYTFEVDWNEATARCLGFSQRRDSVLVQTATEKLIEKEAIHFYENYQTNCIGQADDALKYSYEPKEYHYTLYYYDQAGNLVQTVPPKGVKPLSPVQVDNFLAGNPVDPAHELLTRYRYNSLNQLTWQHTPDADNSQFWYDGKGQLRLSQNAKQAVHDNYSYTRYDALGRVIEVGQLASTIMLDSLLSLAEDSDFPAPTAGVTLSDITRTYYDSADNDMQGNFAQQHLRSRVSWVAVIDSLSMDTVTTHYSYDIHGNVKSLMQYIPGLGNKQTDYVYDLVSGNVNYVFYQLDSTDQFLQKYAYDADNRLTEVHSSSDGFIWNTEARYFYYPHGPLARVELGERSVQGLDYYYTLQGWLKGVNGNNGANDPAQDGMNGSRVGKDAMAFALGYHEGDYKGIGVAPGDNQLWNRLNEQYSYSGLHNGNIAWMQTHLAGLEEKPQQAMLYQYDQLNRLVLSRSLTNYSAGSGFASRSTSPEAFDTQYSYDPNGNLLTLQRHNAQASLMDDYSYTYTTGTNRLANLEDAMPPDTTFFDTKVYDSGVLKPDGKTYRQITVEGSTTAEQGTNPQLKANEVITLKQNFHAKAGSGFHAKWVNEPNYEINDDNADFRYDEIGNLIADSVAGTKISWTPYGKVRQVSKEDGTTVTYRYDGAGNRVEKKVASSDSSTVTTRYIRDASGNVLAIYQDSTLTEQPIYGSSRLGMYRGGTEVGHETLGNRQYELSNHLGNILAVITDNINMDADSTWSTVASLNDYYPFGMEMEGRGFNASAMEYGFNGKMKDSSFGSTHYDYGFRIYSPKVGKFLSVDPLFQSYPELTPFQFASNSPIFAIDLDGLEMLPGYLDYTRKTGVSLVKRVNATQRRAEAWERTHKIIHKQEPSILDKASYYFEATMHNFGEFSDAEDISVLTQGKTIRGEDATWTDYTFAGGGAIIPFLSGSAIKNIFKITAETANSRHVAKGWDAPYDTSKEIYDLTVSKNEQFVRVFKEGENTPSGAWIMKQEEIAGLTPKQIQNKYALDYTPDKIVNVDVPLGTNLRTGTAARREGLGDGGGQQFELLDTIPEESFNNVQDLK